jgi:hypothetical protein
MRVPGARTTVPGEGAVPPSAENRHLVTEFLSAPQKLLIVLGLLMLVSVGGGTVSVMRSAQSAAASSSTFGWPANVACTLAGSQLVQTVRRK